MNPAVQASVRHCTRGYHVHISINGTQDGSLVVMYSEGGKLWRPSFYLLFRKPGTKHKGVAFRQARVLMRSPQHAITVISGIRITFLCICFLVSFMRKSYLYTTSTRRKTYSVTIKSDAGKLRN